MAYLGVNIFRKPRRDSLRKHRAPWDGKQQQLECDLEWPPFLCSVRK
jgi:hypothetical protein